MYYVIYKNSELYHHGILGQKWGKRQGPPYPLDASDHSSSEKKAGWAKSLKNSSSKRKKKKAINYVYKDAERHFRSGISEEANKVTNLLRNGYDSRDMRWGEAYSKGKVTNKDDREIKKSASDTRAYIKSKYGEEVYNTMAKSGELFSTKWIDESNVDWKDLGKQIRGVGNITLDDLEDKHM